LEFTVMGMREWANNHPKATGYCGGACVLLLAGAVAVQVMGNRRTIEKTVPDDFFSVDDGKTFFKAAGSSIAPFDYEGKIAVRAAVFECGGNRFVGYLDRYKPEARQIILAGKGVPPWVDLKGREVKRPGDAGWTSGDNLKEVSRITTVTCPGGSTDNPEPVEP
jgi:hypothetical protein